MAQFMLLLYDLSPMVDTKWLAPDAGRVLRSGGGGRPRATDGPYSET